MFPTDRQHRLNPLLTELGKIKGVTQVQQDDWDSTVINVILSLDDCNSRRGSLSGNKPSRFAAPVRTMKGDVRKACTALGLAMEFSHWPKLVYSYMRSGQTSKDGYDCSIIGLTVYV